MTSFKLASRIGLRLLPAILLASSIFLIGATWYYTPVPQPAPAEGPLGSENTGATSSAFTPFLHVVPDDSGSALLISAGSAEVGGAVWADVRIGGGNHKGGTMIYSPTVQAYITTIDHPDLLPAQSQDGSIRITSTLGLNTGEATFNRAYIPASDITSVTSSDNKLQLKWFDPATFPVETYVVVVPSYAPPGPAPAAYRFVTSAYSVRASGAQVSANKNMLLQLGYDLADLAGAEPQHLAILAWDANERDWDNLGGQVSVENRYVSVATRRFATYILAVEEQSVYLPLIVK